MSQQSTFVSASAYQDNILELPVAEIDATASWYCQNFGMHEIERSQSPVPQVVLERDGVKIGFAVNGGNPEQDGAAIRVQNLDALRSEFETKGVTVGNRRIDERNGETFDVFFVVAPDGLCFYFHELIDDKN